jgi:uncharacterized protein
MKRLATLLAGLLLCLFAALAIAVPAGEVAGLVAVPPLTARVTDLTATLSAEQQVGLEQKLASFEARKGAQIVVLILPSTQPETIEQFGIRLFDAWKIGRKGVDDGAMLIVARDDRRLRIEVGYGLEGALNDATAKRIIAEVITPHFKTGDLPGGIAAGVDAMIKVVDGEPLPAPGATNAGSAQRTPATSLSEMPEAFLFGMLAAVVVGGTILRRLFGNFLGSVVAGGITGGLGWLLVGGVLGVIGGVLVGMFLAVFGLDIVLSGVLSGGRGGGSRGGGGGFGGGGGSGGGGGASGRW